MWSLNRRMLSSETVNIHSEVVDNGPEDSLCAVGPVNVFGDVAYTSFTPGIKIRSVSREGIQIWKNAC